MKSVSKLILFLLLTVSLGVFGSGNSGNKVFAEISASHVYHNHMPNFWPYYDTSQYSATSTGAPIRYMYDGQVIDLKNNAPSLYPYYLPTGAIMPHDDLVSYYTKDAKSGAYLYWPWSVANDLHAAYPSAQMQVTMSGSVVNNVNSFMTTNNVPGYNNTNWGAPWKTAYNNLKTPNNNKTLDMIHFSGHHSMGPLTGNDYLLKDMIYQNATLAQSYFLGDSFTSSKGFFPTELGFSERLIPVLEKLGIKWSVLGNNHLSRTLQDYPYLDSPGIDTLISPPNRADFQNTSNVGSWVKQSMFNEAQNIYNKFPFASTPHWVRYVNPETGKESRVVGVPVAQSESWEEGYQGSVTAKALKPFEGLTNQKQFLVIAHDGDNAQGRAGSLDTWQAAKNVTYSDSGVKGEGIDEYLVNNTPAATDVVHVQDGSWVDTRDSSSDPTWYHWHMPFGIWKGQFADFNKKRGMDLAPKKSINGVDDGHTVSFEYGFNYLERNFALLQASENYAKTAEQIWLTDHPNYWKPTTAKDKQITYEGNQLNPYMLSYPVKGNAASDYAGGANPAELAWYFLLPAMDSGFGYYDENIDDSVKPALSFSQSLYFSKPYVNGKLASDQTGPSVWWPQRYPYNPGSANNSKAEGWTLNYFDNSFGIYTYAFDASGIQTIKLKVRTHRDKFEAASDNTSKVYDPALMASRGISNIDVNKVSAWTDYAMTKRDLKPEINGTDWQSSTATMQKVPVSDIGDMYYSYLNEYRDQLVDYYIEATDSKGNVTKSDIQSVYVGAGKFTKDSTGKLIEDVNGAIIGTHPFLVVDKDAPSIPTNVATSAITDRSVSLTWKASTDNVAVTGYEIYRDGVKVGTSATNSYTDSGLIASTSYNYTVKAYDMAQNISALSSSFAVLTKVPDTIAPTVPTNLLLSAKTASTVTLTWTASTDNYQVAGYEIWRDSVKVATSVGTTYTDSGLSPTTAYQYSVKAYDAANNKSPNSDPIIITTDSGNVVTIYYKQGYATPYIHYRPTAGTWTTAPGVVMTASEVSGYNKITINIGPVNGLEAAFNNGSGTWDNNGGKNYTFPNGTSTFVAGVITAGLPQGADITAPTIPTNVTSTGTTQTTTTLSWTASTDNIGVTGYEIWRNGVKVGTTALTSYTNTGLTPATAYNYTVKAYDAAGNISAASAAVSVTTTATLVDVIAPTVPTNVSSTTKTATSITLGWTASTDNVAVTGYEVWRGSLKVGTSTSTSYTDSGLTAATAYSYTVKAYDAAGNISATSALVSITTSNTNPGNSVTVYYKQGYTAPYIHYRPTAGTWTTAPGVVMPASEVAGYNKMIINVGSATGLEAVFNNGSGTWDNNGGKNYNFPLGTSTFIAGVISAGLPQGADITAPTIPTNVTSTGTTDTRTTISWTASTDNVGVTGYEIWRNGVKVGTTALTNYSITGLTPATVYSYTVKAYDAAGNISASSAAVSVTTTATPVDVIAPTVPTNVSATTKTETTITLGWTASVDNVGVTGYEVWRDSLKVGTSTSTSYTDSGLTPATVYSYTVKAYDATGSISAASAIVSVSTNPNTNPFNAVTVYYKQGFAIPFIHYRPIGGAWTNAPGIAMLTSEVTGYNKITIDVGSATGLEAVFNNGSGTWDNNGGKNYVFSPGTSTFTSGVITSGEPQVQTNSVNIKVTVPANTPAADSLYISGTFNNWLPADSNYKLTKNNDGTYSISLTLEAGTKIDYKITRGAWSNVETHSNASDIDNRSHTAAGGTENVSITVLRWKDL
ncbi:chitodextrinase [Paenibacillus sp. DS2015]|uniref:carbohydrate binding domain-containing protein n=1 Tax=Paenibacillus sp. DS2015 TaxID=3373917 RepID=UPI003D25C8A3